MSAARHQLALTGFADDSLNAAPPPQCSSSSPVPPPAGVELQRLLLPLPPALHPEVGPGLGLPRVLRDRRRLRSEGAPVAVVRPRPLLVLFSFRVGYFLNVGGNLDGEHQAVGFWFRGEPGSEPSGFLWRFWTVSILILVSPQSKVPDGVSSELHPQQVSSVYAALPSSRGGRCGIPPFLLSHCSSAFRYTCYCGKLQDPPADPWLVPHSCGAVCQRQLKPSCGHTCLLLCHPGNQTRPQTPARDFRRNAAS